MLADTNPKMRGYFNPRSREGSDFTCRLKGSCINISIRAPTRGATIIGMLLTLSSRFQSALPRGERRFFRCRMPFPFLFQSTLPRGERLALGFTIIYTLKFQSTLPRGERRNTSAAPPLCKYFNPRSREGSDRNCSTGCHTTKSYFNPRSREGSDPYDNSIFCPVSNFNPRSREGSDCKKGFEASEVYLFQSTLPRGERHQFSPKSSLLS